MRPLALSVAALTLSTFLFQSPPYARSPDNKKSKSEGDFELRQKWGLKTIQNHLAERLHKPLHNLVVAVVDTGIDTSHEDLRGQLWVNPGETGIDPSGRDKKTNGIDDDRNGFVDDVHGWNFVNNSPNLEDSEGHGTHVAGIIAAKSGNGVGVKGVAPHAKLMILKYYDAKATGSKNLINTIRAFDYAVKMNAHIINYSGGGTSKSHSEFKALQRAREKNILIVAAAGNLGSNADEHPYYPADYPLENIISVAALGTENNIIKSSNYGARSVDLAAPGEKIFSCLPNNKYGFMTGTSQATAFVTGVAALVQSNHPSRLSARELKQFLLATGQFNPSLQNKIAEAQQLNSLRALSMRDSNTDAHNLKTRSIHPLSQFSLVTSDPEKEPQRRAASVPNGPFAMLLKKLNKHISQQQH